MSCETTGRLYVGNDIPIEIESLYNPLDSDDPIIDATVTVTAYDPDDVEVTGVAWPVTLDYVSASEKYAGVVQSEADFVEGTVYRFVVDASAPGGLDARWEISMTAEIRRG